MRILYVVQRYGEDVAGGSEQHCREMAERLVDRGHHVEVATTCAKSYADWADAYEPGRSRIGGVVVHRFPVAAPRRGERFNELNRRLVTGRALRPRFLQREWMRQQGPWSPALAKWLDRNCEGFDCVVCITYLYWTTWAALHVVRGRVPLVLHPTAHDESTFQLSLFDDEYRVPDAFALLAPEEAQLIRDRFHFDPPGAVVGLGVEVGTADAARFRAAYGIGERPYLLYVGRVDIGKNVRALVEMFKAYKERHADDDLVLALVGDDILKLPAHDDIVVTGFVDTQMRNDALSGAFALAQPSMFESFSMILTEAFAYGRPALVEAKCAVLRGHAERSSGAIPYDGFAEFEVALEMLRADPALGAGLGESGRAYVAREYRWDVVMDRYEALLERTVGAGADR